MPLGTAVHGLHPTGVSPLETVETIREQVRPTGQGGITTMRARLE